MRETTALFYLDIPNIPPTVADAEDLNKNEQRAGCETPSGHYKDGDMYASNSTGIRPTNNDQCVMCVCQVSITFLTFFKKLCKLKMKRAEDVTEALYIAYSSH